MAVHDILTAIQDSPIAHAISKTDHMVGAGLQIVHVMGLVLFLASLVLISLRLLRWALADQPIEDVIRQTARLMWWGLGFTAFSGTLMFIATPKLYYYNWAFGLKMLMLVIALAVQFFLFQKVARSPTASLTFARVSVAASVFCWTTVALTGRMIGFV
ncbi:hypothetical protein HNQ60_004390 [Povalibacter uvarum]|uniref:DUF6644 domain-containing protein n=1 Tax=Povalibacter uvarum TaxID=732238 RepID=A0A841HTG1_9GAMM|nr:DUF6644 family protein [Povalibacter uvarum]MBB6095500.1 hypothetical protein [Povalibacter uvarum]